MARKLKADEAKAAIRGVSATDLKRLVRDINRHRENASENAGLAGQATKQAVEQYSLDRKALAVVVGLARKEATQQQSTLRGIIDYADKLGMLNQLDMYDDLVPVLERIVARAKTQTGPGSLGRTDKVMDDLVDAAKEPEAVH